MTRSRRSKPIASHVGCASEKHDKKAWHRRFRKREKQAIYSDADAPLVREVSNPWSMGKDGSKRWFDPSSWPKGIRK